MSKLYRIIGFSHSDEITYYSWDVDHKYPGRELIKGSEKTFTGEFNSMDEASLWLLENNPDLYMGHCVNALDESGDFSIHCVPGYYYSQYETTDDEYIYSAEKQNLINMIKAKNDKSA